MLVFISQLHFVPYNPLLQFWSQCIIYNEGEWFEISSSSARKNIVLFAKSFIEA